jgi:hypothetical protein
MPIKVAFLLGAGVSIPAGLPSTVQITERIISGEGVMRHTDESYYFGSPSGLGDAIGYIPRVVAFLKRLKVEVDLYYSYQVERSTNYEDLYYVASQIYDSESGDHDNPAVQPLVDQILPEIQPLLDGETFELRDKWELIKIASEATHYIRDVVWHLVAKKPSRLDHLGCVSDACKDSQLSSIDVFTLNHDTVLEQHLSESGITVADGFDRPVNGIRYWNSELFEGESVRVRLLKLHGSVNWFRFRPHNGDWSDESIGIPLEWDIWHTRNPKGQRQWPVDGRPMILVGTFNKMLQYTSSIYADFHYRLYRSLRDTRNLIVCGYGFGDKGINTYIAEWIAGASEHQIIVIHPKTEGLRDTARGAIRNKWEELERLGKLKCIPKRIEDVTWEEIMELGGC